MPVTERWDEGGSKGVDLILESILSREADRSTIDKIFALRVFRSRLLKKMSLASSKLNPHAAAYVPLAKRVEDESKLAPVHFDSSKAFAGSSSHNTTEFLSEEEGQLEMDLAYLQTLFPSVSEQSLTDVYFVNECDLDAAYDMMSQLEHSDSVSSLSLPDSLEIGDVSEPHILPEFANLKLKELEGVSSSASVNSPAHAQAQK